MFEVTPRRCALAIIATRHSKSSRRPEWYVHRLRMLFVTKYVADSFTRYWFYLLSLGGIPTQLKEIELACKDLFGELEDDPKLQ